VVRNARYRLKASCSQPSLVACRRVTTPRTRSSRSTSSSPNHTLADPTDNAVPRRNGDGWSAGAPDATLSAPGQVADAGLTVVPTEIGPPDPRQAESGRPGATAQPCSSYVGQRLATSLPKAYGHTTPYAA
jgi:hypothetical protein